MKIDGKAIAANIFEELKKKVEILKEKSINPHLAIVLVGNDPSSEVYVRQKELKGNLIGVKTSIIRMTEKIKQTELFSTIEQLNNDNNVHGLIVQQPLPSQIDPKQIILKVNPKKDIDGLHPNSPFPMPLSKAVLKILEDIYTRMLLVKADKEYPCQEKDFVGWLKQQRIVVMGKGETGGGPTITMFRKLGIEPEVVDSKTKNPEKITKTADIIISAVGRPNILKADMLKKGLPADRQGVILIGVGMHRGDDNKMHGDYNEEEIESLASFYTPVPGGVGPVNVAMLLENLISAALGKK